MIGGVDPVMNERSLGNTIRLHELFIQGSDVTLQVPIVFAKVGHLSFELSIFGGEAGDLSIEVGHLILQSCYLGSESEVAGVEICYLLAQLDDQNI